MNEISKIDYFVFTNNFLGKPTESWKVNREKWRIQYEKESEKLIRKYRTKLLFEPAKKNIQTFYIN